MKHGFLSSCGLGANIKLDGHGCRREGVRATCADGLSGMETKAERQELSGDKLNRKPLIPVREFLTGAGQLENQTIRAPSERLVSHLL